MIRKQSTLGVGTASVPFGRRGSDVPCQTPAGSSIETSKGRAGTGRVPDSQGGCVRAMGLRACQVAVDREGGRAPGLNVPAPRCYHADLAGIRIALIQHLEREPEPLTD